MDRSRMLADDDVVRALFDRAIDLGMAQGWVEGYTYADRGDIGQGFDVTADDEDGDRVTRRVTLAALRAYAKCADPLMGEGYEWLARTFNASPPKAKE